MDAPAPTSPPTPVFRRVLLKLSGESFCKPGEGGLSEEEISRIARQTAQVARLGVSLAIVVGGGNILRGATLRGSKVIRETTAHYMGMTATMINGLALQDALEGQSIPTRLMTTIRMDECAEPFIRRRALSHLENGRVVILVTGTGSPYVTTDTAAALRGKELEVEVILKATKVDGVYSAPPEKNPHAIRYDHLTFEQVMQDQLKIMDMTAIGMCLENKLPILVFDFKKEGNMMRAILGEPIGTWVGSHPRPTARTAHATGSYQSTPSSSIRHRRVRPIPSKIVPTRISTPPRTRFDTLLPARSRPQP